MIVAAPSILYSRRAIRELARSPRRTRGDVLPAFRHRQEALEASAPNPFSWPI